MVNASYSRKSIETKIVLAKGSFTGGNNTISLKKFASNVHIEKSGLPDKSKATVQIYGLSLDIMEQITTLAFRPLEAANNVISILAGIEGEELSLAFQGEITSAFANFSNAPDISVNIEAMSAYYPSLIPQAPKSFEGVVSVENLIRSFAKDAGYDFINEGFTGSLRNPIFNGSPIEKAMQVAKQVGAKLIIDDGKISLLPANQATKSNVPLINKNTGLIAYPTFSNDGISLKCLYLQDVIFNGLIEVQSIVPKASGIWRITKLSHALSAYDQAQTNWFSNIEATPYE